jgi:cobalamin synthase
VLAAIWFIVALVARRKDRGLSKLGVVAGIWAVAMAAWAAYHAVDKTVISALVVIPLLVSTIVQFGMIIAAVSRVTKGKFSQRVFMAVTLTIIGMILLGVVLMFQPFTPTVFNLGFDFVLIALLAFNIWSHVTPRAKVVETE